MGRLAAEAKAMTLDTGAAADRRCLDVLGLQNRPLLDVELEIRGEPFLSCRRIENPVEADVVLGQHVADRGSLRVPQIVHLSRVEGSGER